MHRNILTQMRSQLIQLWKEEQVMLRLTLLLALVSYILSRISIGFYQGEEISHWQNIRQFWNDPSVILGLWPKPGYKVLIILPSFFGQQAVVITNCLVTATTCFLAYKIAKGYNAKYPQLAFWLLATQPMWLMLSFRNYPGIYLAFIFAMALYFHQRKKFIAATLCIGHVIVIRYDFGPLVLPYLFWLLWNKKWKAVLASGVSFGILFIIYWIRSGEFFSLLNAIAKSSAHHREFVLKRGFWHYFHFFPVSHGAAIMVLSSAYLFLAATKRMPLYPLVSVPAFGFLLIHSIFMSTDLNIGPGTGGNLRYMNSIAPAFAILTTLTLERLPMFAKNKTLWVIFGGVLLLSWNYHTFTQNMVRFFDERDFISIFFPAVAVVILVLVPSLNRRYLKKGMILILLFCCYRVYFPFTTLDPETATVRKVALWYSAENEKAAKDKNHFFHKRNRTYATNSLFYYYANESTYDTLHFIREMTDKTIRRAKKGDLFIWDSHYSPRRSMPGSLNYNYFTERPREYKLIKQELSSDKRFGILIFVKIADSVTEPVQNNK